MKTALVFGSSGLIGGHLLNQLLKNDDYNKINELSPLEWVKKTCLELQKYKNINN